MEQEAANKLAQAYGYPTGATNINPKLPFDERPLGTATSADGKSSISPALYLEQQGLRPAGYSQSDVAYSPMQTSTDMAESYYDQTSKGDPTSYLYNMYESGVAKNMPTTTFEANQQGIYNFIAGRDAASGKNTGNPYDDAFRRSTYGTYGYNKPYDDSPYVAPYPLDGEESSLDQDMDAETTLDKPVDENIPLQSPDSNTTSDDSSSTQWANDPRFDYPSSDATTDNAVTDNTTTDTVPADNKVGDAPADVPANIPTDTPADTPADAPADDTAIDNGATDDAAEDSDAGIDEAEDETTDDSNLTVEQKMRRFLRRSRREKRKKERDTWKAENEKDKKFRDRPIFTDPVNEDGMTDPSGKYSLPSDVVEDSPAPEGTVYGYDKSGNRVAVNPDAIDDFEFGEAPKACPKGYKKDKATGQCIATNSGIYRQRNAAIALNVLKGFASRAEDRENKKAEARQKNMFMPDSYMAGAVKGIDRGGEDVNTAMRPGWGVYGTTYEPRYELLGKFGGTRGGSVQYLTDAEIQRIISMGGEVEFLD